MNQIENIDNNIKKKILFINDINNIFFSNIKENIINDIILLKRNYNILLKYYNIFNKIEENYDLDINPILVEYYNCKTRCKKKKINKNNINIYVNIDILYNNNIESKLSLNDFKELEKIFNNNNKVTNDNKEYEYSNIIKKKYNFIHNQFNNYISQKDIYGNLDSYVEHIKLFLSIYIEYDKNENLNEINKLINDYNEIKIKYKIIKNNYNKCVCGFNMVIYSDISELVCEKCGLSKKLTGTVFEDIHFFSQERYKFSSYDYNRHFHFWLNRIQALENTEIPPEELNKIKLSIKKDNIKNMKNIKIEQFRRYLKDNKLTKLNDHIPLIKKLITGESPPKLTEIEYLTLINYFDKTVKTYEMIKNKVNIKNNRNNFLYYPFVIFQLLNFVIKDNQKKKKLLSGIHLQGYSTLIVNDKYWKEICNHNKEFKYKPTNRHIYD